MSGLLIIAALFGLSIYIAGVYTVFAAAEWGKPGAYLALFIGVVCAGIAALASFTAGSLAGCSP